MNERRPASRPAVRALVLLVCLGTAPSASAGIVHYDVRVDGLACPFCAYGLQKKLGALPGVSEVRVELEAGTASFEVSRDEVVLPGVVQQAVRDAGFTPRGLRARASGFVERIAGALSLRVSADVALSLREGRELERLAELAAEGRRVTIEGELSEREEHWALSVDEVSAQTSD